MAISFVKSLSKRASPGSKGYTNKILEPETLSDDEEDKFSPSDNQDPLICENAFDSEQSTAGHKPAFGGPFSALPPSMWPQDLLAAYTQPEDSQPLKKYDKYGFIIERPAPSASNQVDTASESATEADATAAAYIKNSTAEIRESQDPEGQNQFTEDEAFLSRSVARRKRRQDELRAKWIAYLEFTFNETALPQMKWSQVENQMRHSKVYPLLFNS